MTIDKELTELLKNLDKSIQAEGLEPGEFTTRMYAKAAGITRNAASSKISALVESGVLESIGRKPTININGEKSSAPVYRKI